MSASTIRTRMRPGENVYREAAARRGAMVTQRRQQVDEIVSGRLASGFASAGSSRDALELRARFDAFADLAPATVREEVQELFDQEAAAAQLAPEIDRLEEAAASRYERGQVSELGLEELARKVGGAAEETVLRAGRRLTRFRFDDGHKMKATVGEAEIGAPLEIVWHAAESDIPTCDAQHAAVREIAARSGMDVVEEGAGEFAAEEGGAATESGRGSG